MVGRDWSTFWMFPRSETGSVDGVDSVIGFLLAGGEAEIGSIEDLLSGWGGIQRGIRMVDFFAAGGEIL